MDTKAALIIATMARRISAAGLNALKPMNRWSDEAAQL